MKRWIDLVCMTIIAILICVLLTPSLFSIAGNLTNLLLRWSIWYQYSIVGLIAGLLWFVIIRLGGFRLSDCNPLRSLRYPPVWLFGLIGVCLYILLLKYIYQNTGDISIFSDKKSIAAYAGSVFIGISLAVFLNSSLSFWLETITSESRVMSEKVSDFQSILENPKQLIDWIQEESPINHPSKDLFNLTVIAKRIAKILLNAELKTIGIVGSYGCGKSSLLNLVEYYLQNQNEIYQPSSQEKNLLGHEKTLFSGSLLIGRIDGWGAKRVQLINRFYV